MVQGKVLMEQNAEILKNAIAGSLNIIEQDREKEIVSRRFGLSGPKETLEQIGEMLSITRERVRQLEKAILIRLQISAEENQIPEIAPAEKLLIRNLTEMGRVARLADLADKVYGRATTANERTGIYFIATFSKGLTVVEENDRYHAAVGISEYGDSRKIRERVDEIVKVIKENKKPMTLDELDSKLNYEHPDHIKAVASISKLLATLNGVWGLAKWPSVNPKNIRDKIFVILEAHKEPMHFSEIAREIKESNFKRKNVTTLNGIEAQMGCQIVMLRRIDRGKEIARGQHKVRIGNAQNGAVMLMTQEAVFSVAQLAVCRCIHNHSSLS